MLDVFECHCKSRKQPGWQTHDEVTLQDCRDCLYRPRVVAQDVRRLYLKNHLSPGDVLVMSAAIHSLHQAHPGKFQIAVDTSANALFEHNPDVMSLDELQSGGAVETIGMHYPLIQHCNQRAVHFMQGYCDHLEDVLKVRVPLMTNRPIIYLSREERDWIGQVQEITGEKTRYWIVNAGKKNDFTAKYAGVKKYQDVVDLLRGKIQFVQVGSAEHHHPALEGVIDLRGKTDMRQLVRLVYHAEGVLCGVTFLHHLAAALEKPSVVLMGGREPVPWNSYPRAQLLHTVGALDCCAGVGCWKSRVVPLGDNDEKDGSLCVYPIQREEAVPRCLDMISAERIVEAVLMLAGK